MCLPSVDHAGQSFASSNVRRFVVSSDETRAASSDHSRAIETIEPRIFAVEVGVAAIEEWLLASGADAAAGILAVLGVQPIGNVHPVDNPSERRKPLSVLRGREIA